MSPSPFSIAAVSVFAPFVAGLVVLFTCRRAEAAGRWAVGGALSSLAATAWLLSSDALGETVATDWVSGLGLSLGWRLELAPLALAALIAGIGAAVLTYSGRYFRGSRKGLSGIAWMSLFLSAMLGMVLAAELYQLFVFWEMTGVFSFLLIGMDRTKEGAWKAARQAFLVTVGGGLPFLAGIVWIEHKIGTTRLAELAEGTLDPTAATIALALVLPAALTKSAQLPFSSWLPGAMAAPTPVSALLHSATLVKAGIVLLLYLAPLLRHSPLWGGALVPLGAATCVWGAYKALSVSDLKRLLAFSTVSQLGLLTLTLGLGTDVALRAVVLHLFAHAIFKAGLFLAIGSIEQSTGTREIDRLGALRKTEPVLFLATLLLTGSMAGIPPLAGFLSKELILKKAMLGQAWTHGLAISGIVLGSIGTVAYSARIIASVFFGRAPADGQSSPRPLRELMPIVALATATLVAGLSASWVDRWFLEPVAESFVGRPVPFKELSLWYGLNVAVLLTAVIVGFGWLSHRRLGLRLLPASDDSGPTFLDRFLKFASSLGRAAESLLAGRSDGFYYGALIASAVIVVLGGASTELPKFQALDHHGLLLSLLMVAGLGSLLMQRSRLGQVLSLSGVGLVVALLFRRLAAPDLMLTQVTVEIVTTVVFAAALVCLPKTRSSLTGFSLTRVTIALGAGASFALLSVGPRPSPSAIDRVPDFLGKAPELAAGANVVNVILTDFRAIDTLIETLVIALAAIGAVQLVSRVRQDRASQPGAAPRSSSLGGLLPIAMPWLGWIGMLLAVALLVKGHDQPGGGFVAGLVAGVTLVIQFLARPDGELGGLERALKLGVAGLSLSLLWPVVLGLDPLTHRFGKIELIGLKWHTALVFDVAIAVTVAAGVTLAAVHLQRRKSR